MAEVRLYTGTQRSRRAAFLDEVMRAHWETAVFLLPTRELAARRLERLVLENHLDGMWGRKIQTFEQFAISLISKDGVVPKPIDEFERSLLLEDCIARLAARGTLSAIGESASGPGFLAHMQRIIAQLKQGAIEPDEFREKTKARRSNQNIDTVVADIYLAYQTALIEAGRYDRQGLYWEAHRLCQMETPAALEGVNVLLLDGFDDFTASEFRLLKSLEKRVNLLILGMNLDTSPGRQDLYRLALETAARIRAEFDVVEEAFPEEEPRTWVQFAASRLFWRDQPSPPGDLTRDLTIRPCPGVIQEIECIGRRIKSLLLEGVKADQIAVVYRDISSVAAPIRSAFGEFGIPVKVSADPHLCDSSVGGFLLNLLEALETWERERVVDVLISPWFSPGQGSNPAHVDRIPNLSRQANIIAGFKTWNDRLRRLVRSLESTTEDETVKKVPEPQTLEAARALLSRFDDLADIAQKIPSAASMCGFIEAVEEVIESCGIDGAVANHPVAAVSHAEGNALRILRSLLVRMYGWYEAARDDPAVSRDEFVHRLRTALSQTTYPYPDSSEGIACYGMEGVRGLRFDYVFLGGVNEGEVPRPPATNAIYGEGDIQELAGLGIPLDGRKGRADREALLFHHVLEVPRVALTITYRSMTADGKTARPSPFLEDVIELLPGATPEPPAAIDSHGFLPQPHDVASLRDLRNVAFGAVPEWRQSLAELFLHESEGARIEKSRHSPSDFDVYDGELENDKVLASLLKRFGRDHTFSVKQIETYLGCPFRFFFERVLEVEPTEAPDEDFDPRVQGTVLHDTLQAFHHAFKGKSIAELDANVAEETMLRKLEEAFQRSSYRIPNVLEGLGEAVKMRLHDMLMRYLAHERSPKDKAPWKPEHFEVSFGLPVEDNADPLGQSEPFALNIGDDKVSFMGRIDRIDLAGERFRLVDYKTSSPPRKRDILNGNSVQLGLYAMVAESLFKHEKKVCGGACFLRVGYNEWREGTMQDGKESQQPDFREVVTNSIGKAIQGIRSGSFPPTPLKDRCSNCPAHTACRHESGRIARKLGPTGGSLDNAADEDAEE